VKKEKIVKTRHALFIFVLLPAFVLNDVQALEASRDKKTIEIGPETVKKGMPSYAYDFKRLVREAEKNIGKVNRELEAKEKEKSAKEHFERGKRLYESGKPDEAEKEWQKTLKLTKDPRIRKYIRQTEKKERQERHRQKK